MASILMPLLILGSAAFLNVVNACTHLHKGDIVDGGFTKTFLVSMDGKQPEVRVYVGMPKYHMGSILAGVMVEACARGRKSLVKITLEGYTVKISYAPGATPAPFDFKITSFFIALYRDFKVLEGGVIGITDGIRDPPKRHPISMIVKMI